MARRLTYAEQQRLARRTSDISRLQSEYQRSVQDYSASVGVKESAFKAEMDKYNELYSGYEGRLNAFKSRLQDYQAKAKAYADAPLETYKNFTAIPRLGTGVYGSSDYTRYGNQLYGPRVVSGPFIQSMVRDPNAERGGIPTYAFTLKPGYSFSGSGGAIGDIYGKSVLNPGEFTEKFEEPAPAMPAALDVSKEKAKLDEAKAYTEREVDERAKARVRAVQRANARPMLSQGVNING